MSEKTSPTAGRRRSSPWLKALTIMLTIMLAMGSLYVWHARVSFPVRHAMGDDLVLQLQAFYKANPSHVDQAIRKAHDPHVVSTYHPPHGMENDVVSFDVKFKNLDVHIEEPANAHSYYLAPQELHGLTAEVFVEAPDSTIDDMKATFVYLRKGDAPLVDDSEATVRKNFNLDKNELAKATLKIVWELIDDTADNW